MEYREHTVIWHRGSWPFPLLLLTGIVLLLGTVYASAHDFRLFGKSWHSSLSLKTAQGWNHVYLCPECRLTPSFTIITSTSSSPDPALLNELERSYDQVSAESGVIRGQQTFSLLRARQPRSSSSPPHITVVTTRYQALIPGLWHDLQAVINTANQKEEQIAQDLWLNLLGHASIDRHSLTLFPDEQTVIIDIASPGRSWFSDLVEQMGMDKLVLGTTLTTAGLVLLGVQAVLGAANVRGPCGKPLGQCPCTKSMLKASGLPVL